MKTYIYAKSSHRDGLDNVRRASALCNILQKCEPILCTGDYRASSIARDSLGVKDSLGIDAMGNLPHTMERLDILIYDNEDVTKQMHQQMQEYSSKLYTIGKEIPFDIVEKNYFQDQKIVLPKAIFFSDEDYRKWFLDFCKDSKKHDIPLLNGNYFFLDTQKQFEESFSEVIDEEKYEDIISSTEFLLCANMHTCLESLASGHKPVFFQRGEKETLHLELLEKYNIPTAKGNSLDSLMEDFERIIQEYPQTVEILKIDFSAIENEIIQTLKENAHISRAIDYTHSYVN